MSAMILVVDDEPDVRMLCRVNLEFEGHVVIEAEDGAAALEKVAERRPDLILLDIMMPGIDGWEVMRVLKENQKTAAIPVVLLTAKADEESQLRGWDEGVLDYVTKPFNPISLTRYVEHALEQRDPDEEARRRELIVDNLRRLRELREN